MVAKPVLNLADESPPDDRDWETPSKVVVASDGQGDGMALWWKGPHAEDTIQHWSSNIADMGLEEAPRGISVWEGKWVGYECPNFEGETDWDIEAEGEFRKPTDEEWEAIKEGRNPW